MAKPLQMTISFASLMTCAARVSIATCDAGLMQVAALRKSAAGVNESQQERAQGLEQRMVASQELESTACGSIHDSKGGTVTPVGGTISVSSECAIQFSAPNTKYLEVTGGSFRTPEDGAFTMVARLTKLTHSSWDIIFDSRRFRFGFKDANPYMYKAGYKVFSGGYVNLGTAATVALVFDGTSTFEAFIDGVSAGTHTNANTYPSGFGWADGASMFRIGAGSDSNNQNLWCHSLEADVSYVKQYDYAMSGADTVALPAGSTSVLFEISAAVATTTTASTTAAPVPSVGASSAGVQATGDPHLQNIHGQKFDLLQPGKHTLLHIPSGADVQDTLLHTEGHAQRLGSQCADMYFLQLNVTGAWAEAKRSGGFQFHADEVGDEADAKWISFGKMALKVVHGHTSQGLRYLNFYVKHLGSSKYAVGGLLGEDDHTKAATPDPRCAHSRAHFL